MIIITILSGIPIIAHHRSHPFVQQPHSSLHTYSTNSHSSSTCASTMIIPFTEPFSGTNLFFFSQFFIPFFITSYHRNDNVHHHQKALFSRTFLFVRIVSFDATRLEKAARTSLHPSLPYRLPLRRGGWHSFPPVSPYLRPDPGTVGRIARNSEAIAGA